MKTKLIFTEIICNDKTALMIEGPETECFDFIKWCVHSFNPTLDLWIMKVERSLLTTISSDGKILLPEEPKNLPIFYQISFMTDADMTLFKLKWIDEDSNHTMIKSTQEELICKFT